MCIRDRRWKATKKEEEYETIDAEIIGIELLFQYWEQLPVEGGCIYIDNQLEAFSDVYKRQPKHCRSR